MGINQTAVNLAARRILDQITDRRNRDILILAGLGFFLPVLLVLPVPLLRVPIGLAGVFLLPGYALVILLFSKEDRLDLVARLAVSFGLSIAILPLLALLLNALPWGIQPWSMAVALSTWILLCCGIALFRRRSLFLLEEVEKPPSFRLRDGWQTVKGHLLTRQPRLVYILTGVTLLSLLVIGLLALVIRDPNQRMTEFYILGREGRAENYPRGISSGQEVKLNLGIKNHEGAESHYQIEITSGSQRLARLDSISLLDEETWEGQLGFTLNHPGDNQQVQIDLFLNRETTPHRQLMLWIDVQ